MTKEESIEVLKDLWRYEHSEFSEKDIREALDMAINSLEIDERYELEYEQAEPCEDAISRRAVINILLKYTLGESRIAEELKDLPPINPQEPSKDCIDRQPLIDNWNSCADMLTSEGDSEIVMGWIFNAPSVTPTQEPVLDKIRAEIQENINYNKKMNYQGIVAGLLLALDIIDKYKAEIEPVNGEMLVCPECGLDVHSDFKTCPRCGAKMVESQERGDKE